MKSNETPLPPWVLHGNGVVVLAFGNCCRRKLYDDVSGARISIV